MVTFGGGLHALDQTGPGRAPIVPRYKRTEGAYGPLQAVAERRQRNFGVYPPTAVM